MKKICVIGYPAKHSLSPIIHNYWLEQYQIKGSYEICEIEPHNFDEFFLNLSKHGYAGCNITIPYKERAFKLAEQMSDNLETQEEMKILLENSHMDSNQRKRFLQLLGTIKAQIDLEGKASRAINTVNIATKINAINITPNNFYDAKNSDGIGFIRNLQANFNFDFANSTIVMLGAGGAARAVTSALIGKGAKNIYIVNRTIQKAEALAQEIGLNLISISKIIPEKWEQLPNLLPNCNLLINATSMGMIGQQALEINLQTLNRDAIVADIVYNPLVTQLLQSAISQKNPILEGLGMLIYQAIVGFEMWFEDELCGQKIEIENALINKLKEILFNT